MSKKGKLIIFSGVSGVGKNTLLNKLFEDKELNLAYSTSMTTRTRRSSETHGKDYFFVTDAEFDSAIENGELLEWEEFAGNRYGTPKKYLQEQLDKGLNVILEIEVKGALNVMNMQNTPDKISIFLLPPSLDELKKRLINRGTETDESIEKRIKIAEKELRFQDNYDYTVVNNDINKAVKEVKKIIACELKK